MMPNEILIMDYNPLILKALQSFIEPEDLEMAREQQKRERKSLTDTLVEMGYADEDTILACYSVHLGIPCIPLPQFPQRASIARMMPPRLGYEYNIVPVDAAGKAIVVAVSEPLSEEVKASIEAEIGKRVTSILARRQDIQDALRTYYPDDVPEDTPRGYQEPGGELEGAIANA